MDNTQTNGQVTSALGKATKDDVIVDLTRKNLALLHELTNLQTSYLSVCAELEMQNEEAQQKNVPKAWIASFVEALFMSGSVPAPRAVLKRGLPFSVTCDGDKISFPSSQRFQVSVQFHANGRTDHIAFDFKLAPVSEDEEEYPDFHYGFAKVTVPKKRVRKSTVIKPPVT